LHILQAAIMSITSEQQEYLLRTAVALSEDTAEDYFSQALPSQIDEMLARMAEIYLSLATAEDRALVLTLLDDRSSSALSGFAHRMSMLAVRRQSEALLTYGLVMLALAFAKLDWREATMTLSLMYHSGEKLSKAQEIFTRVAAVAPTTSAREWLLDFARRKPEDQRIEAMGFKEVEGPHGLIYQYGRQPIPEGWM
jgi:hypothetical protein